MNDLKTYLRNQKNVVGPLAALVVCLLIIGCGGHSTVTPPPPPVGAGAPTIMFLSGRALDGSNAANTTGNIWVVKTDGTGLTPVTRLTVSGVAIGDATWSPDGTRMAFVSRRALDGSDATGANFALNVWVVNADGSGATALTKLVSNQNFVFHPAWSPDGKKLAFQSSQALDGSDTGISATNIWLINADGTGATPITKFNGTINSSAVWSPDGSKIAIESNRFLDGSDLSGAFNIWVMNADGSGATALTKLTNDLASNVSPHWSPDGSKLAFESTQALDGSDAANTNKTKNVWVVAANGSGATPLTRLTAAGAVTGGPVWSPDGKRLAFNSARGLDGGDGTNLNAIVNVWVVKADGSGASPFTHATASLANNFVNGWSPDGSTLAFASGQGLDGNGSLGLNNIWIINSDGSNSMPLTRLTMASSAAPAWKP